MKRISTGALGIQQGSKTLFSDFADGGPMWTGSGPRESRHSISFAEAFQSEPSILTAISMWDADAATNLRADLSTGQVTRTGFELVFRTWGDSRIARLRVDWTAIGMIAGEDDWDVDGNWQA